MAFFSLGDHSFFRRAPLCSAERIVESARSRRRRETAQDGRWEARGDTSTEDLCDRARRHPSSNLAVRVRDIERLATLMRKRIGYISSLILAA